MYKLSSKPLISKAELSERVNSLAAEIAAAGEFDILLGILTGSFIFVSDLVRAMPKANEKGMRVKFFKASSYGDSTEHGSLKVSGLENLELAGLRVLLVDDILDTGNTLYRLVPMLKERGAAVVKTCVLLDKPSRREAPIEADFVGFKIENKFVVGYGLDYADDYRTLPEIMTMEEV